MSISIHAPTRGATQNTGAKGRQHNFNPRSHERSDIRRCTYKAFFTISIHAPTRGATAPQKAATTTQQFQSTLPREERPPPLFCFHLKNYFNPRSHERSDQFLQRPAICQCISIHAPTRGATFSLYVSGTVVHISIHAPTRGATRRTPCEPE